MRDPASAAPPIPWEERQRIGIVRWLGTLLTALRPVASAPAFARGEIGPAISFALLSFVPLAMLAGIIPYTHTLGFREAFTVSIEHQADRTAIAIDVARAAGLGLLVGSVSVLALAVPYISLSRAYADRGHAAVPARVVLYRAFLIPLGELLLSVLAWSLPANASPEALAFVSLIGVMPLVLLFASLRAGARMASGVGMLASIATAAIPFVVMMFARFILLSALGPLIPPPLSPDAPPAATAVAPPG